MESSKLKSYLTGLILGDGYVDNGVQKRAFRIKTTHKDFADKILEDLLSVGFKCFAREVNEYTSEDGTKHKKYYEVNTKAHPYFSKIYHVFYDDYRNRIITKKALNNLGWEGWANWFMSDGYIVRVGKESGKIVDRRVELCTDRYSENSVLFLAKYMETNFGYKIKVVARGEVNRIRISLLNAQDFFLNIYPFFVPSFLYKLDMCYDYKPTWMSNDYYSLMKNIQSASPLEIG